ncbi:DUF4238 domain-containing protein [Streptomyces sp. enrichment culture]|uniref:DUF4238 domain-containing protein n=1 Tax=Streptomyces sp. enrichment culture TaxID=1795815 RepID=UPI003F55E908
MPQHAKKHHFVPQFLLHLAGPKGKLVAHQVMNERRFPTVVRDLGHRNFGHSIYRPGQEPDHISMEEAMGSIEGEAATVVRELVQGRERAVPAHARSALAWLLALQWQRSRFLMHVAGKAVRDDDIWTSEGDDIQMSDEQLQTSMMGFISMYVIEPWLVRNDEDAYYKDQWNHLVSTLLDSSMHWSCYRPRGGGLLVGDNSVCFSGVVGTPPENIPPAVFDHGVGIGFENFRRLTLPLGSSLAVIISRDPQDASRLRVADINRYTVFNSREFVAHAPDWAKAHPVLARELPQLLERQRTVAPAFLQGYAPGGRN